MQCQKLFQANAPINCVCLHPNQAALVIGDQTGALHLWDLIRDTSSKVVCVCVSYGKYVKMISNLTCADKTSFVLRRVCSFFAVL